MAQLTDILTVAESQTAIHTDAAAHAARLEMLVSGVSEEIDRIMGPVVARTVTARFDGGGYSVRLATTPVYEVTSVTEYSRSGSPSVLTAEDDDTKPASSYLIKGVGTDRRHVRVFRRASGSGSTFAVGEQNVVIVYEAGRCADTATAPAAFKEAASAAVAMMWQLNAATWAQNPNAIDDFAIADQVGFVSIEDIVRQRLGSRRRKYLVA